MYLAMLSPSICAATLCVCVALWGITLVYGENARRTQKVGRRGGEGRAQRVGEWGRGCMEAGGGEDWS